jgi:sulfide:quinone oxidoreductase
VASGGPRAYGRNVFGFRSRTKSDGGERPLEVVIAGGGVAALETALGLHRLAGDRVRLTLVAPTADFVYRPMTVLEPFVDKTARRLPLTTLTSEIGATFEMGSMVSVDPDRQVLHTDARELPYDALVVAVGARTVATLPGVGAVTLDPAHMDELLRPVMEEIESGSVRELALVAPASVWPLPVYEMALYLRAMAREKDVDLAVTIVTAEPMPAAVFGATASAAVAATLADAGIETILGATAEMRDGGLLVNPGQRELRFARVVAFPRLTGPAIAGLPADADGFIPTTAGGEVTGVEHVYAAGDATDCPVKFGGISAHQADIIVDSIAALAGASVAPTPSAATLQGTLLTGPGRPKLYLSATLDEKGVVRDSAISDTPASPAQAKIAARYLGPYLDELWATGLRWLANQLEWEPTAR